MKNKKMLLAAGIIIVAMIFILIFVLSQQKNEISDANSSNAAPIKLTESNFAQYMSYTDIVHALPDSASIQLLTTDSKYIITKGSIEKGVAENPDITITIPSSYLSTSSDKICETLSNAYNNGDLSFSLHISKISAAWKYSGMFKYKNCLGILS